MNIKTLACCALTVILPSMGSAQEAFITQVAAGPASVALTPPLRTPGAAQVIASLNAITPTVSFTQPDLSGFALVDSALQGSVMLTQQTGNNNASVILQTGLNAASVSQNGNNNASMIMQNGSGNRASVYQAASNGTSMIQQSGSNNMALSIQR
jgi:hypothetical protein